MTDSKKMGRPTDNPKDKPVHVRLDRECMDILDSYQSKFKKTKAESIRDGIRKLKEDL